ncbi:MAG: MaoC family dehydratase [Acetobacteraceae bacterium]|nr:MaoC family dehydratase [Acetobacteraceae bacterium]
MAAHLGKSLGTSEWVLIDQGMIDRFADATGDHQWIHVDRERAKRDMPGGKTIAHGFLTLSLLPRLGASVYRIKTASREINYGCERVRFTAPVQVGSRVRLAYKLKRITPIEGGQRLNFDATVEIEGEPRPALIAETIFLAYD